MRGSKPISYSATNKFFHWLIAIFVIAMLSVSFFLDDISEKYQGMAYMMHKSFGITILFLVLFHFIGIQISGRPPLPFSVPRWQKFMSLLVQYSLYLLLLIMPLSGWIMSVAAKKAPIYFGLVTLSLPGIEPNKVLAKLMNQTHKTLAWVLLSLVVVHILAAMKHHFFDKDNVLRAMLPERQPAKP